MRFFILFICLISISSRAEESTDSSINKTLLTTGLIATPLLMLTLDKQVKKTSQSNQQGLGEEIVESVRPLGNGLVTLPLLGGIYLGSRLIKDSYLADTTFLAFKAFAYTGITVTGIKYTLGRSRPYTNNGTADFQGPGFWNNDHLSFPSGDSGNAWSMATVFALRYKDKIPWLPYVLFPTAAAVSYGRIYDNKHFLSDVFVGGLIGFAYGYNISNNQSIYFYPVVKSESSGFIVSFEF